MNNFVGILIGGLLPALVFGLGAIFQKHSNNLGIEQSIYLACFAIGILLTALVAYAISPSFSGTSKAAMFAIGHGALFGFGFIGLALGFNYYGQPVSRLIPLANMSTVVTVVLGLIVFREHVELNVPILLVGSLLVVIGGVLVSLA